MRRWLAIVLLALLPLQFSWAAVAAYCGHESGEQVQHLGHHDHQHAGQTSSDAGSLPMDQDGPAAFDFDCGHCHGSCAGMPVLGDDLGSLAVTSHRLEPVDGIVRSIPQSPPERPQWLPLA